MAQTFRTDPNTGRTVISQDNVVGRNMSAGERVDNRISDGGATVDGRDTVRRGYESMNAPTRAGTGYMSRSEFESLSGMTATNPYGNDGIFSRVFGIDPSKIDYTSNLGARGIENVKRQAYDRFMNPFAKVDAFGRPTMGADFAQGTTRSGVQPGDLTIFGPAAEGRAEGIGALIGNALGLNMNPTIIPGTVGSDARSQDRGIYDFEVPENMDQLVSAALREDAIEARDPAAVPESTFRPLFTTDPEERNLIEEDFEVDRRATEEDSLVPSTESTYDLESRLDRRRAAPPTVAEIILNEELTPSGNTVIQNIGTGDTGSATITRRSSGEGATYYADDEGPSATYPLPGRDLPFNRFGTPASRPDPVITASDEPVNLLSDILASDGTILPGVMDSISSGEPRREVDPRTGRIPGTSGTFDFAGGTAANVTTFSPQDVARMNKRAQDIDALRFQYIQQGMNPTLAFARARMQVGG